MTAKVKNKKQKSTAFKDLKAMPCFEEFDLKVRAGIVTEEIARWLQEDMFQQTEIQRDSLVRKIFRYKAALPPAMIAKDPPLYVQRAIEKMQRGVREIDELEKLYLLQLRRISIDAETETKINKLFGGTNAEIRLASDLLKAMLDKKMELGILQKTPEQFEVSGGFGIAAITNEDVDEQTKAKMGLLAGKLLDRMAKSIEKEDETKKNGDEEEEIDDE
jgi:hypothetical protein